MSRVVLAAVLLAQVAGVAQMLPPPVTLHSDSATVLSVPGFSDWGNPQCDDDGDMYFHIGTYNAAKFLRLSSDGGDHGVYEVPDIGPYAFEAFNVSRSGDLYVLVEAKTGWYVFTFRKAASSPDKTRLDLPDNVSLVGFSVTPDASTLVSGYFDNKAAEAHRGKPYFAKFTVSGKLIADLSSKSHDKLLVGFDGEQSGAASQDEAGNLYFAAADKITVFSSGGDVLRRLSYTLPDRDFHVVNMVVKKGRIALWVSKAPPKGGKIITQLELLDSMTGDVVGLYQPDDVLGNSPLCFDGNAFTFFRVKNGFVQILEARLR